MTNRKKKCIKYHQYQGGMLDLLYLTRMGKVFSKSLLWFAEVFIAHCLMFKRNTT